MARFSRPGTLDPMNLYELSPTATQFLAEEGQRWGHHGFHPAFLIVRIVVWILVIAAIVFVVRKRTGRRAELTLRDVYAKGEVDEAGYRERLAVLRDTRRPAKK